MINGPDVTVDTVRRPLLFSSHAMYAPHIVHAQSKFASHVITVYNQHYLSRAAVVLDIPSNYL